MPTTAKRTISLPEEHAEFIDRQVASGAYASGSEVVRAGLRALQERDAAIDRWLENEVAPAFDAVSTRPDRAIELEDVFYEVRKRHAAKLRKPS